MFIKFQHSRRIVRFIIKENGIRCASAYMEREPETSFFRRLGPLYKPTFYFNSFYVENGHRRKGYGIKMLKYIKSYYRGCNIVLQVCSTGAMTNEQLIAYYERAGFKRVNPEWYTSSYPLMYIEA